MAFARRAAHRPSLLVAARFLDPGAVVAVALAAVAIATPLTHLPPFWAAAAAVAAAVRLPVIASGGAGTASHMYQALTEGGAEAALAASIFHFGELSIAQVKEELAGRGLEVRR